MWKKYLKELENDKEIKFLEIRKEEVMAIRSRFPTKIPVIVKRLEKEKFLPPLDKQKYLVPKDIVFNQFVAVLRCKLTIPENRALCLIINEKTIIAPTLTMAEIYRQHSHEDGYLYVQYASQETFGG